MPVFAKKVTDVFVPCFSPEGASQDIEKSLEEQLKVSSLICTTIETSSDTCACISIFLTMMTFRVLITQRHGQVGL